MISLFTTRTDRGHITHSVIAFRLNHTRPHDHILLYVSTFHYQIESCHHGIRHLHVKRFIQQAASTVQQNPAYW